MIGTVVGSYEVLARLGGGGVAEVYRVRHTVLDTVHALKVLKSPSDKARQRLVAEGRIQARLRHPNVVAVTDVLQVDGAPALLLDLVHGPTLGALIAHDVRRPDLIDVLGHGVLAGMAAAHAEGLVHRDLKPGNVLVAIEDDELVAKVTDFGLARGDLAADDARLTATGASLGTPLYMAPEQVRDARRADQRSDVWALGVLLYELVVGEPPFAGADRLELFQAIDLAAVPDLADVAPHAPERWRTTIATALQRDPAARPPDAAALLASWGEPQGEVVVEASLRDLLATLVPTDVQSAPAAAPATWGGDLDLPPPGPPHDSARTELRPPASPVGPDTVHELGPPPLDTLPDEPTRPQPPAWRGPALLAGAIVATGVLSAGLTTWLLAPAPTAVVEVGGPTDGVVAPIPAPPPAPPAVPDEIPERERGGVAYATKALEKLLDGSALEAERDASMVVAGSFHSELPELVQSAGAAVTDRRYTALYELGRGRAWEDDGTLAAALLRGMVAPHVAAEPLAAAPTEEAMAALVMRLLILPLDDQVTGQLDRLDALAPNRRLPLLVRSRVMRRQGRPEEAREALVAGRRLGEPTSEWEVEEALVELATGDAAAARARLEAIPVDRRSPINAHGALVLAHRLLDDEVAVATDLERIGGSLFTFAQVHLARVEGAWRRGAPTEAFETLDRIEAKLQANPDDMVGWWRVEVASEKARLAASLGDEARLAEAVGTLRSLTKVAVVGWGEAEALRRHRAAEALLAGVRGRRGQAEVLLDDLRAQGQGPVAMAMLQEWLDGGAVTGVSPRLLP